MVLCRELFFLLLQCKILYTMVNLPYKVQRCIAGVVHRNFSIVYKTKFKTAMQKKIEHIKYALLWQYV